MRSFLRIFVLVVVCLFVTRQAIPDPAAKLNLPPATTVILDHIYSGRRDLALPEIRKLQEQEPQEPLGYLLEAEARWWEIWCVSAEFKYGMTMARHHNKAPGDERYLELTTKAYNLANAQLQRQNTAEMRLYAAMADALAARLYGIRAENRASARVGVRARENFLAALELDPTLSDAYTGLGLYNYYVDTLSMLARALRFMMGIPGGTKQEGIRQLQRGMTEGQLSATLARFYLAMNLLNYDQKYEEALTVIGPLTAKYPQNPMFLLMQGDLNAKLRRRNLAEASYHAAGNAVAEIPEAECRTRIEQLVRQSLGALEPK